MHDIRYAIRTLRRSAGLTLLIVASLAIGIGANTAIFSVVNALLLKPLPYPDADRLVVLWLRSPGINIPQDWPSPGQYLDIQQENRSFAEMAISHGRVGALLGAPGDPAATQDGPQRVEGLETSSSLFHLLGATPLYGRLLRAGRGLAGTPARRRPQSRILAPRVRRRSGHRGQAHHVERIPESGHARQPVRGRRRARA